MSPSFKNRLLPILSRVVEHFGTPFHIYDETGIRETGARLLASFAGLDAFREYFAVKALPNPRVLAIMKNMGFGLDCSSISELALSRQIMARGADIMYTSNNTSNEDFIEVAATRGSILNLDDISLIDKVPTMPELICFRYNPGPKRIGNDIIGNPVEAKYGVRHDQIVEAYRRARERGAKQFGLHTMLASNELNYQYMVQTATMLLRLAEEINRALGITFDFINIGGGLGIPYLPESKELQIETMGLEITAEFDRFRQHNGYCPALFMESGRYMTGPHGSLVVTAINRKETYRTYIGVDACMNALMRPALYGAYHHIDVIGGGHDRPLEVVDVVGSLCENNDKFAIQRQLPRIENGDILLIHDTGAHGHAMGFNYNGTLRPKELLLRADGGVDLIRRSERLNDYFATLNFAPDSLTP